MGRNVIRWDYRPSADTVRRGDRMGLGKMVACAYECMVYHVEVFDRAALDCASVIGSAFHSGSAVQSQGGCEGERYGAALHFVDVLL